MSIVLFVISIACALLFGLCVNSIFLHKSRVTFLLGWFVLAFAGIVLTAEICSLLSSLNKGGFLFVQLLLTVSGWGLWKLFKAPAINGQLDWQIRLPPLRTSWLLYIFALVCIAAYVVNAVIILRIPQNNYDSMTYHLARVGYWMQNENLFPWDTANPRQTSFPFNAEIGLLWSMLYLRSDTLTGFVQWLFTGAGFLAIYGMSILLGAQRKQALFAGLAWLTLPQIVLQSTTTQNDIVVSSLLLISVYFLYRGWKLSDAGALYLSGISLGLASGTKLTAGMAVPGLGIVCLILWIKSRQPKKFFFILTASYLMGFLLFGSIGYIQNLVYYGTILGPKDYSEAALSLIQPGLRIKLQTFMVYVYQFLDFAGLPPDLAQGLVEIKAKLAAPIFDMLGLRIYFSTASVSQILNYPPRLHEDFTWFGPLSLLGIIPGMVIGAWQSKRRKNGILVWGIILVAVLFSGMLILQGWSPHKSRYMVLTVTMLAPFLFYLYSERKPVYTIILTGIGCLVLWNTVLHNEAKPIIGLNAIWGKDAIAVRTINYPTIEPLLRAVNENVPKDARLAVKLGGNGWDYVFFGDGMRHTLLPFKQNTTLFYGQQVVISELSQAPDNAEQGTSLEDLIDEQADYLIVGPQQEFFLKIPPGLEPIYETESGSLYRVIPEDIGQPPGPAPSILPGADSTGIIQVDTDLSFSVGVMSVWSASWGIEEYQGDSFLWLGQGASQGLAGKLWAEKGLMTCVNLALSPGPSREDTQRSVNFVYLDENNQRVVTTATFDRPAELSFELPLHQGVNPFGVSILEPATILAQPNGDNRALLARLDQIEVMDNAGSCP